MAEVCFGESVYRCPNCGTRIHESALDEIEVTDDMRHEFRGKGTRNRYDFEWPNFERTINENIYDAYYEHWLNELGGYLAMDTEGYMGLTFYCKPDGTEAQYQWVSRYDIAIDMVKMEYMNPKYLGMD